jgi:outer membrane protein TolC
MKRCAEVAALASLWALGASHPAAAETIQQAWAQALATNPQLAAAYLDEDAARSDLDAAQSGRLPAARLRSAYAVRSDERNFRIQNPFVPGQTFVTPFAQREAAIAGANVTMPLYAGGRIASSIEGADARLTAAVHGSAAARLDLLLAVSEAGLSVLRAQQEVAVAERKSISLHAYAVDVGRRFEQQQVPRNEALAADVAASAAQQAHLRQQHALATARGEYNRLLCRPLDATVELDEIAFASLPQSLEELQQLAIATRPDLAELRASAHARVCESQRIRAAAKPQISAVGAYDFEENRYQTPQAITSAAVVVDWSVYNGGQYRRAAEAELTRASSLNKLGDDLASRIMLELMTARNSEQEALARREVSARALEQAEENLRVVQLRYARGMAIGTEVLDAEALRAQSASDYLNAGYDVTLARMRLRYSAGILGCPELETGAEEIPTPEPVAGAAE